MMKSQINPKDFIINECLLFSISAAFQTRNRLYPIYKKQDELSFDISELPQIKENVKSTVHNFLKEYTMEIKSSGLSEPSHIKKIIALADILTQKFESILHKGRFRIGISQKLINLFIKYMWSIGELDEPIHCPIDGIIKRQIEKNIGKTNLIDWTKLDSIEDYMEYITSISFIAKKQNLSVAVWELTNWNRQ